MTRPETVKSAREIDRLFRQGKRYGHRLLVALVAESPDGRGPGGRVAFIAGKKLGGAVRRNKAKRLLRQGLADSHLIWPGKDVALVAKPPLLDETPSAVREAIESVSRKMEGR